MRLSPHFSFQELTHTNHKDYLTANRAAAKDYIFNLKLLTNYVLEPVRFILQTPLIVTSGFRSLELNGFIGGEASSQHLWGQACDFIPKNMEIEHAFKIIEKSGLHYGQLLQEYGKWLHISLGSPFRELDKCNESLRIK